MSARPQSRAMNRSFHFLRAWIAWALLAGGCGDRPPPPPTLTGITPAAVHVAAATPVELQGDGFRLRVRIDLDAPERSEPNGAFAATLRRDAEQVPLDAVSFIDSTRLSAVIPPTAAPGRYSVSVVDPWGRTARLEGALLVGAECIAAGDCDDGLTCTADACVEGVCAHVPLDGTCAIDGACYAAGDVEPAQRCRRCEPTLSATAWTDAAEDSPCEDGDLCTSGERCTDQVCGAPTAVVSCEAVDQCHAAGTCDPATGVCSTPALVNGTPCDDQDLCTLGEACHDGACGAPTQTVQCPETQCLQAGACNALTGECEQPPRSGSCDDQSPCTAADTCESGVCRGTGVCGDTAPSACLTVSAAVVTVPGQVRVDPRCTTDLETLTSQLEARFDLDGDGIFELPFAPLAPVSAAFATAGVRAISVEIRDPGGNLSSAARHVVAVTDAEQVVVTTPRDEDDPGATVAAPLGTGLSLREALRIVNAQNAPWTIRFAEPMTLRSAALPTLTASGARIVGGPGIQIAFDADTTTRCLELKDDQLLAGIELSGCGRQQLLLSGARSRVLDATLRDGLDDGLVITGSDNVAGPGLELSGFASRGVVIRGDRATLRGARVSGSGEAGIQLGPRGVDAWIWQCRSWANQGPGVELRPQHQRARLWQNTLHANSGDGIAVNSQAIDVDVRGNLVTQNLGFGLCGPPEVFVQLSPNGYWQNGLGDRCAASVAPPSLVADPGYVATGGDFRLRPGSPAIDASVDLGLDLNGASAGPWFGSVPDLGAVESPH